MSKLLVALARRVELLKPEIEGVYATVRGWCHIHPKTGKEVVLVSFKDADKVAGKAHYTESMFKEEARLAKVISLEATETSSIASVPPVATVVEPIADKVPEESSGQPEGDKQPEQPQGEQETAKQDAPVEEAQDTTPADADAPTRKKPGPKPKAKAE